jgi:glycosyltransferase involved in cell wall biosynthesis
MILHGIEAWTRMGPRRGLGLRSVDSLVFTTEFSKAMFLSFNGDALRPDAESIVIPLSAEGALEARPPAHIRKETRLRALCVTRLTRDEPLKGVSTLLQAAALLDPHKWEIVIAGDGDGRSDYEAEAARLGVLDRVRFPGWVADQVRTQMLEDADVFCLPSAQEGFGIAFLEAMVAGRPCVGAAAGAVPEVVGPETGEIFPYGDAAALASALQRAAERVRDGELTPASIRAFYDRTYSWQLFREHWKAYATRMRA